jgi:hypothetical protein
VEGFPLSPNTSPTRGEGSRFSPSPSMGEGRGEGARPHSFLTHPAPTLSRQFAALFALLLLGFGNTLVLHQALSEHRGAAATINVAGTLRWLSQSIAYESQRLAAGASADRAGVEARLNRGGRHARRADRAAQPQPVHRTAAAGGAARAAARSRVAVLFIDLNRFKRSTTAWATTSATACCARWRPAGRRRARRGHRGAPGAATSSWWCWRCAAVGRDRAGGRAAADGVRIREPHRGGRPELHSRAAWASRSSPRRRHRHRRPAAPRRHRDVPAKAQGRDSGFSSTAPRWPRSGAGVAWRWRPVAPRAGAGQRTFVLHYQPQVDLRSRRRWSARGAAALAAQPTLGWCQPSQDSSRWPRRPG